MTLADKTKKMSQQQQTDEQILKELVQSVANGSFKPLSQEKLVAPSVLQLAIVPKAATEIFQLEILTMLNTVLNMYPTNSQTAEFVMYVYCTLNLQ